MARTAVLRWEWTLANGARIAAELDTSARREVVFVGNRIASEGTRGAKALGHTVVADAPGGAQTIESLTAVVTFEPRSPICILRVDGFEVAPMVWPTPQKRALPLPEEKPARTGLVIFGVGLVLAVIVVLLVRGVSSAGGEASLATHRAANGLFIAHYPSTLKVGHVVLPAAFGGLLLEHPRGEEAVLVAALTLDDTIAPDRWALQHRFHDEVLANFSKVARSYTRLGRRDEKCVGEPGAVVTGGFDRPSGGRARVWTCTFVKESRGYFFVYVDSDPSADARLRSIVEATELTQLANLGTTP